MKVSLFQKNLKCFIIYLNTKYFPEKKISSNLIIFHFSKIDLFIRKIVIYFLNFIFILTKIIFLKQIYNLSSRKQNYVFKLIFHLPLLGKKIYELFNALILIHAFNSEKLKNINFKDNIKNEFEFIVIGSGPGGSITASEIVNYSNDVLILEEGDCFDDSKTKHPGSEFLKKWRDGGIKTTLFNNQITFSSGKTLGGGSEINSGLFHLPDESFINHWKKKFETKNFEFKEIQNISNEILENFKLNNNDESFDEVSSDNFIKGAQKLNFKIEKVIKLKQNENKFFKKLSMKNTYLKSFLEKKGKIKTNCYVDKIFKKNNKWCLKIINKKKITNIFCKYLFVCCGSIYTNLLLSKSNLINKKYQKKTNFKFHPMVKIISEFENKVQSLNNDVHPYQISEFYPKYILGNAASSPQFILSNLFTNKEHYEYVKKNFEKMSVYHTTFSIGKGNLIYNFFKDFKITNYNISNNNHLDLVKSALIQLSKVLFSGGAKRLTIIEKKFKFLYEKNYQFAINNIRNLKDLNISSVHILGGIKMGESKDSISDSYGKIKDTENLYVNDSSLINNSLLKNPQGTIMTIALRNIRNFFFNDYQKN